MHKIISEDADAIAKSDIDWQKIAGKTVLVAGATGYVPQNFIHGLLRRNDLFHDGIKVVALCRSEARAKERFEEYFGRDDFQVLLQDVCDKLAYEGPVDFIIHAASPASQKERYADYVATVRANVIGCDNLLRLAKEKEAVFLLLSSVDVYGKMADNGRLVENHLGILDPLEPHDIYACAKRAAETICLSYSLGGVSCKIARPSQILGPGISRDDGRLHIDFINQMLQGDTIVLKGDGKPMRTFMYVTDAVTGMLAVMLNGESGEAYNIVWEKNEASVLGLAETMIGETKNRHIEVAYNLETRRSDPSVTKVVSSVCGSSAKIQELGWRPMVTLPEACHRMMAYYGLPVVS